MTIGSNANYPTYRAAPIRNAATVADNTAVDAGYGFFICASVAGTVTLTLEGGNTIVITPAVGDNIYPFAVTKSVTGTATVTRAYNIS
jgi:hypothetical protein